MANSKQTSKRTTPRKIEEDLEITPAEEWAAEAEGTKLKLPSGKVCLAKQPGMQVFLEKGIIPNGLLPIIMDALNSDKPPSMKKDLQNVANDPERLRETFDLMNAVLVECVIQPVVHMPPEDKADRVAGRLYADIVDLDDKVFIFQWAVGGTRNLERFRQEQTAVMADLSPVKDVEQTS